MNTISGLVLALAASAPTVVGDGDLATDEDEHPREPGGGVEVVVDDQDVQRARRVGGSEPVGRPEPGCRPGAHARLRAREVYYDPAAAARAVAEGPDRSAVQLDQAPDHREADANSARARSSERASGTKD